MRSVSRTRLASAGAARPHTRSLGNAGGAWRSAVRWTRATSAVWMSAALVTGCLGKPEIQERWTRVDVESSSLAPNQTLAAGTQADVTVRAAVTYRAILTGVAVAELRASSVTPATVELHPDAERVRMAQDIDRILANSVSMGRATRAVTGWDHLIQRIDFTFQGLVPAGADSSGNQVGLFLICYLGQGTEIELPDGSDSLVVTPFGSTQYEVLPVGMELTVSSPGAN